MEMNLHFVFPLSSGSLAIFILLISFYSTREGEDFTSKIHIMLQIYV
ncbi:unnamed protein product [Prunus brigantina]